MTTLLQFAGMLGGLIALATFVKAIIEYSRNSTLRRAEVFLQMRIRLKETDILKELCDRVEASDPKLAEAPLKEKLHLTGFFEEVALLLNSGMIRKDIAHYMFGYYAISCWECEPFWRGLNRDTPYWSLLRDFVSQMQECEKQFTYRRKNFRL